MDNLSAHRDKGALEAIRSAGASILFLPPYSPEWNPIEKVWAKLKELVRRTATNSRELFAAAVAAALNTISSADLRAWFSHCGDQISST